MFVGLPGVIHPPLIPDSFDSLKVCDPFLQFRQFLNKSTGENRPAAPRFRVQIFVVQMERRGVSLPFPLIATPQSEESFHPDAELRCWLLGEDGMHDLENFNG